MNTTTNTTTTTTTNTIPAPELGMPLSELFAREELFVGVEEAQAWLDADGSGVLREQAIEAVNNLLNASSKERRDRGLQLLERAIVAQAAWLQLFELMAPCGGFEKLKRLVTRLRDEELDTEGYDTAKQAVIDTQVEYSSRKRRAEAAIAVILDLAAEEAFLFSARADMLDWQVRALDAVLEGRGLRQHPNTLDKTAERLSFLSKRFFGEIGAGARNGNGGAGSSKSRQDAIRARKAARAARDRAETAKRKGGGQSKKG